MAKYSNTKAKINEKITTNTTQAITGNVLNEVLQTMVDSLGADYQFGGLVQPGSSFTAGEQPVVFLATTPGTYTNFGSLVMADGEVALLVWSGTAWSKQTPDIATRTEVSQLGQEFNEVVKDDTHIIEHVGTVKVDVAISLHSGSKLFVENNNGDDFVLFLMNNESDYYRYGVIANGESAIVEINNDYNFFRLYSIGESPYNIKASYKFLGLVYDFSEFQEDFSEFQEEFTSLENFIDKDETISISSSNAQYSINREFRKGTIIEIATSPSNANPLFVFGMRSESDYDRYGAVYADTTIKIRLVNDINYFRLYQGVAGVLYEATIKIIGLSQELEIDENKSQTNNKKVVTIGDSYCAGGIWQKEMSKLTGCVFDGYNNKRYSVSGTPSLSLDDCGQARAKKLVSDAIITPDIIIYENVNDSGKAQTNIGEYTDVPYMLGERMNLDHEPFNTFPEAIAYFNNNISSILSGITPKHGYCVGLPYKITNATIITFTNGATSNGQIIINTGIETRYINVASGESIADIINSITEYIWNRYDVSVNGTSITFSPNVDLQMSVSFNANGTGVTATVSTNQPGTRYYVKTFPLHDMTNWLAPSNWVHFDNITLWSIYKGLFGYLSHNFPNAKIYFLFPVAYNVNVNSSEFQNPDGTLDFDKIVDGICFKELGEAQKEISDYCCVQYLDLKNYAGIYPTNVATYFPANNYHPNEAGYKQWGKAIAKLL